MITTSIIDALDEWWGKTGEYASVTNAWLTALVLDNRGKKNIGFFCFEDYT